MTESFQRNGITSVILSPPMMKHLLPFLLLFAITAAAQNAAPAHSTVPSPNASAQPADDISGMYSFLREGEFVQLTLNGGVLTGFISRYADQTTDSFIDQFFSKASWDGSKLSFETKTIHGIWYEFQGTLTRTPGKAPGTEGDRLIRGTLIEHSTAADAKPQSRSRQVEFRSFPDDGGEPDHQ